MAGTAAITNLLSFDVEDYFQVSAFEAVSPLASWDDRPLRVQRNVEKILALLEERGVKATFFVLGWIAERCPQLIKRISFAGHEIASHGMRHQRVGTMDRIAFRDDVRASKMLLEDLSGQAVLGYRAPSYSISRQTPWAFDELCAAGYRYDSSVFPIRHDFYGMADWPRFPDWAVKGGAGEWQPAGDNSMTGKRLYEFPITTLQFGAVRLPIAGGGYFRLYPYTVTHRGLRRINRKEGRPFVFYLHPWEFDPGQPRLAGAGMKSRFRHYMNLGKTEGRFLRLLDDFAFGPFESFLLHAESTT